MKGYFRVLFENVMEYLNESDGFLFFYRSKRIEVKDMHPQNDNLVGTAVSERVIYR